MKHIKNIKQIDQKGSVLVTLLIFTAVAITVTTGAIIVAAINTQGISKASRSEVIRQNVDSGGEISSLGILRDPDYVGETVNIQGTDITIQTNGTTTKTTDVYNTSGSFIRKIQIIGDYVNNEYNISSWKETP